VTFPLFLIAREMRLATDAARLKTVDVIALTLLAALIAASVVFIDVS